VLPLVVFALLVGFAATRIGPTCATHLAGFFTAIRDNDGDTVVSRFADGEECVLESACDRIANGRRCSTSQFAKE
jgi:hypothetical protein